MEEDRIPKRILYSQLHEGSRKVGRPKLRFRDVCKRDIKHMQMDWAHWEKLAAYRETWRPQLTRGLASGKVLIHSTAATRRENRASRSSNNSVSPIFVCDSGRSI